MDIVADTNIFLAVVLNESGKSRIVEITSGVSIAAPEILPYEVGNALSAMVKRRTLTAGSALEAEKATSRIAVRLVSVDVPAALQIAIEHNIYAYDAYFLQCAQRFSLPLLTLDRRMKQVAAERGIAVMEVDL